MTAEVIVLDVVQRYSRPHKRSRRGNVAAGRRIHAGLLRHESVDAVAALVVASRYGDFRSTVCAVAVGERKADRFRRGGARRQRLCVNAAFPIGETRDHALERIVRNDLKLNRDCRHRPAFTVRLQCLVASLRDPSVTFRSAAHKRGEAVTPHILKRRSGKHEHRGGRRNELRELKSGGAVRAGVPSSGNIGQSGIIFVRHLSVRRDVHEIRVRRAAGAIQCLQDLHFNAIVAIGEFHAHCLRLVVHDAKIAEQLLDRAS